jgi:hypothetical protein
MAAAVAGLFSMGTHPKASKTASHSFNHAVIMDAIQDGHLIAATPWPIWLLAALGIVLGVQRRRPSTTE